MKDEGLIAWHDPGEYLFALPRPVNERKLRLLACACCRHVWGQLDSKARNAVKVAERYADGLVTEYERRSALRVLVESNGVEQEVQKNSWAIPGLLSIRIAALSLATDADFLHCGETGRAIAEAQSERNLHRVTECCRLALMVAEWQAQCERNARRGSLGRLWKRFLQGVLFCIDPALNNSLGLKCGKEEIEYQSSLFRDILGNPFRPISFSSEWRTDTALSLVRMMYDSRDFSAMPILADALQDAGCDNDMILNHCRDANQLHVRGCWVVDLVLGKE